MKSDYYTVTINEKLLRQHGYEQNGDGRYEKLAHPSDDSFERSKTCPKCGSEIRGYLKIVCSNGTLQIKPICEKAKREYFDGNYFWTNLCGAVKQKDLSAKFGRAIRGRNSMTEFFMAMNPPTVTHQEKQVTVRNGKPVFYEPQELKTARIRLKASLMKHWDNWTYDGPVELVTKWCFQRGKHPDGSYRISRPDTDNLQKLLKDCMTDVGFWKDDALVCREITEKFWAEIPGIYIRISELED